MDMESTVELVGNTSVHDFEDDDYFNTSHSYGTSDD